MSLQAIMKENNSLLYQIYDTRFFTFWKGYESHKDDEDFLKGWNASGLALIFNNTSVLTCAHTGYIQSNSTVENFDITALQKLLDELNDKALFIPWIKIRGLSMEKIPLIIKLLSQYSFYNKLIIEVNQPLTQYEDNIEYHIHCSIPEVNRNIYPNIKYFITLNPSDLNCATSIVRDDIELSFNDSIKWNDNELEQIKAFVTKYMDIRYGDNLELFLIDFVQQRHIISIPLVNQGVIKCDAQNAVSILVPKEELIICPLLDPIRHRLGRIDNGEITSYGNPGLAIRNFTDNNIIATPKCDICPYSRFCKQQCLANQNAYNNDPYIPKDNYCEVFKATFKAIADYCYAHDFVKTFNIIALQMHDAEINAFIKFIKEVHFNG